MNILFATTSRISETGGIQEYNRNLLKVLDNLGISISKVELLRPSLIGKVLFTFRMFFQTLKSKPDVIFCSHISLSPLCLVLKAWFNVDYIVFTHGIEVWNLKSKIKIKSLKRAKFVITVSTYTEKKLVQQIPELDNIFILPNTIDGNRFYPKEKSQLLIEKYNLKNKKVIFTLAVLSRIEEYKGYDKVIESLPRILKQVPEAVYILGGTGRALKGIKEMITSLDLEDKIILPGFISNEELVDYYNLCDVFIIPGKREGFGIVFLEALACGKPVIAGNQDGSVDALQNGKVGTLINPDSIDEIANSLVAVLKGNIDNKLLDGKYLREETLKRYGFDKFKEKVQKVFEL